MANPLKIGIIGDFVSNHPSQVVTNEALEHASKALSIETDVEWLPTRTLETGFIKKEFQKFQAIWSGPGNYDNPRGAIDAIHYCREKGLPFIGT